MSRSGRVLVVDDQERWCEVLGEALERGGYSYETVGSAEAALERLRQQLFHVLVLDIRLDDTDQSNTEGMSILRNLDPFGGTDVIKVIMLSAYGTREQMREAFRDHGIVDFLSKEDFDDDQLLGLIDKVFANNLQINLGLDVNWQRASGPEEAVLGTSFEETRLKREQPDQLALAGHELDDLLCRLFHDTAAVLTEPLTRGRSGAGVLRVQPVYSSGGARDVVVKFGKAKDIKIESTNFDQYVRPFVGGGRSTSIQNVLVDVERHVWLIDFLRTGPGHILRDTTLLDAVIRIQLLGPDEATLQERYLLESTLAGASRFSQLSRLPSALPTSNTARHRYRCDQSGKSEPECF